MSFIYKALWLVVLSAISVAVFHPGLNGPFVLDDIAKIRDNPTVRNPNPSLSDFFSSYDKEKTHFRTDPSRPLTYMIYWALWQADDGNPAVFHWVSLTLHTFTALILGFLVLQLLRSPGAAIVASVTFLVLPLNAGTVLYAFAMSDILAAFFALLIAVTILTQTSLQAIRPLPPLALLAVVTFMILALMSKQSAVVIPALMFFLVPKQKRLHATLIATAVLYVVARYLTYGRIGDIEAVEHYPPLTYLAAQGAAFWNYLFLTVIPRNLCLDHAIFPSSYAFPLQVIGWAAWLGAVIWALKIKNIAALGWLWFVIPLLPTGSFMPTTDIFVERRAYWPSAGLIIMAAALITPSLNKSPTRAKVIATVTLALAINTAAVLIYLRAHVFSSDIAVYSEIARIYPGDVRANGNLATAYLQAGQPEKAKPILEGILERYPNEPNALVNLAALHQAHEFGMVDLAKADELLNRIISQEPDNLKALLNMGYLKLALRQPEQATELFNKVLQLSPCFAAAHYGLGKVYEFKGNPQAAISRFNQALSCDPGYEPARRELEK